jgi:hypothetical protein
MKKIILFITLIVCCSPLYSQLTPQQGKKDKFGFVNDAGEFVIKAEYDEVGSFSNGIAWVLKSGKYGFINKTGKYVVKPKYTSLGMYNSFDLCLVSIGGSVDKKTGELKGAKYGFIDIDAREIVKAKYTLIGEFDKNGIAWVNIGGKINKKTNKFAGGNYGYISNYGVELTKVEYANVRETFSASGYAWVKKGKKYGQIDIKGHSVIPVKYDAIQDTFTNDIVWVKLNKKYGYFDNKGHEISPIKYAETYPFADGCGAVGVEIKKKGTRYGYINTKGKEIVEPIYESVLVKFMDKHAAIKKGGAVGVEIGVVDVENKKKDAASLMKEANALIKADGIWAIIDNTGKQITGFEYLNVILYPKNKGFILVTKDGKKNGAGLIRSGVWGIIDDNGKLITPLKYTSIEKFDEGDIALVCSAGMYGWVNMQGEEVIPPTYTFALPFSEGLAPVKLLGKTGCRYINTKNETVLETEYTSATHFKNGIAYVKDESTQKWGGINKQNTVVIPFLLSDEKETADVAAFYETKLTNKTLAEREVSLYRLYKLRPQDKFKVEDTIPDDMWDY